MAKREAEHKFIPGTVYRFLGHTSISRLTGLKIGDLLILPIGCNSVVCLTSSPDGHDRSVEKLPSSYELAEVVCDITALVTALELLQLERTDRKLRLGACEALKVAHDAIVRLAQHGIKARIAFEGSE